MKSLTARAAECDDQVAFLENRAVITPSEAARIAALRSEAFSLRQCEARMPASERMAERLRELDDEIVNSRETARWFLDLIRRMPRVRAWTTERYAEPLATARRAHGAACAERAAIRKITERRAA